MGEANERIGFIGAGMMGSGMCRNLMEAGYAVAVIANRNRAPIDALIADGATEAPTLAALAQRSDVIMICVNSADTVIDLTDRLRPHLRAGMLLIDITTSKPDVTRRIADDLATREIGFVDAPVVGGPAQAASGDLGSFLGGTDLDVARAEPLIATYSADIAHFGAAGQGHTVKLLNNFLTVGLRQLVVQSIQAARRHDVDLAQFLRLAQKGAAGSRILEQFGACALDGDYTRNKFSIGNCRKDMAYAGDLLSGDDDAMALQQALLGAYERLVAAGHGDRLASEMLDPKLSS